MTAAPKAARQVEGGALDWLTVERATYLAIALAALALRLVALARAPLQPAEAETALAAWQGAEVQTTYVQTAYVPLLYDVQWLLFRLTAPTVWAARLLPALVGAALCLLPYLMRDLLGRVGALGASFLLMLSPTWVHYSRQGAAPILGGAAVPTVLVCFWRYRQGGSQGWRRATFMALGVGLAVGSAVYTLLALTLVVGVVRRVSRRGPRSPEEEGREINRSLWASLGLTLAIALLVSSGLLVDLGGVGMAVDRAGAWLGRFRADGRVLGYDSFLLSLVSHEFLLLALAAVGGIFAVVEDDDRAIGLLIVWLALVLLGMLGGGSTAWFLEILIPAVALAGLAIQRLWDRLLCHARGDDGPVTLGLLVLITFVPLQLAIYTHLGQVWSFLYALGGMAALALGLLLYGYYWGGQSALRLLAVLGLVVSLGLTLRSAVAMAGRQGHDPREKMQAATTPIQTKEIVSFLERMSYRQTGDAHLASIAYQEDLGPQVAWWLRRFPNVTARARPEVGATADLLLTTDDLGGAPAGYVGTSFPLLVREEDSSISMEQWFRWMLFRELDGQLQQNGLTVWVRLDGDR